MAVFTTRRAFQEGDEVEVCSKEWGFIGSYYEATIVGNVGDNYVVVYKNLVEECDPSEPLQEIVSDDEVRPPCPRVLPSEEKLACKGARVDAFDNDGWWVGTIDGNRTEDGRCYVDFKTSGDRLPYPKDDLRLHLECCIGSKWVSCDGKMFSSDGKPLIYKSNSKKRLRTMLQSRSVKPRLVR